MSIEVRRPAPQVAAQVAARRNAFGHPDVAAVMRCYP